MKKEKWILGTRSVSYDSNAGISGYGIGKDRGRSRSISSAVLTDSDNLEVEAGSVG